MSENRNSFYHQRGKIKGPIIRHLENIISYDTFIRNGSLYFISTFLNRTSPLVKLKVAGHKVSEVAINEYEPVRYFVAKTTQTSFEIYINGSPFFLEPPVIEPLKRRHRLAISTLFKFETGAMVQRFLEYYRLQGVDIFYLYYNGPVLPTNLPQDYDVHYRIWDFPYWNNDEYIHCAQTIFLSTVRCRYLEDCDWLILVDLDEFISLDNGILLDYLNSCTEYDVIKIRNHWSSCPDSGGPITFGLPGDWQNRTKCIYRRTFKGHFGIHAPKKGDYKELRSEDLRLLHVNTLHPERQSITVGSQTGHLISIL